MSAQRTQAIKEQREIRIRVSPTIAKDYEARGVATRLLPKNAMREEKTGTKHYIVTAAMSVEMHDDAIQRFAELDGKTSRGIKTAYAAFWRQIAYWFDRPNPYMTPGYYPASVDSPDPMDKSGMQVGLLFLRLKIPAAGHEGR